MNVKLRMFIVQKLTQFQRLSPRATALIWMEERADPPDFEKKYFGESKGTILFIVKCLDYSKKLAY